MKGITARYKASKARLAKELGGDKATRIRASFDDRPPEMPADHTLSPLRERKYDGVERARIPSPKV